MGAFCLALLAACSGGAGSSHLARFTAANQAYERGAFDEAAGIYREIASSGFVSPALQYNLGNALFKAGRLGPAILAYERSLDLDPRDDDARSNLEYARRLTADRISPATSPLTSLGIAYLLDLTSADQDAVIFITSWLLVGVCVAAGLIVQRSRARQLAVYAIVLCAAPALLAGASLATKAYLESTQVGAIVLASEVNVLSGAGEENPTLFTVHEGLKVRVHQLMGEWVQVSLENGLAGWMPSSAIEEI